MFIRRYIVFVFLQIHLKSLFNVPASANVYQPGQIAGFSRSFSCFSLVVPIFCGFVPSQVLEAAFASMSKLMADIFFFSC